jgi:hypothetical protein
VLLLAVAYFESPRAWVPWAAMALALALAFASSRWIEAPVRRHAGLAARPWLVIGLAALATAGVVAGALAWRASSQRWDLSMAQRGILQVRSDLPAPYRFKCDEGYLGDRVRPCVFGEEDATRTVVLVGDSIGIQWFPAVAALFDRPGWRVVVLTKSACPMVDAPLFYARIGREYGECARWRARAVAWIAQQRPELVFVGSANTYALTPEQWALGSDRVLGALAGRARRVFVLRATPHLPFDAAACVARRQWRGDAAGGCAAPAVSAGPVADAAVQLAAQRHGIAVLDLDAAVCPGGRCAARRDGVMVYRDSHHVTASYAGTQAPALLAAMQGAGWHDDRAAPPSH